jgi:hypothetical protein
MASKKMQNAEITCWASLRLFVLTGELWDCTFEICHDMLLPTSNRFHFDHPHIRRYEQFVVDP